MTPSCEFESPSIEFALAKQTTEKPGQILLTRKRTVAKSVSDTPRLTHATIAARS